MVHLCAAQAAGVTLVQALQGLFGAATCLDLRMAAAPRPADLAGDRRAAEEEDLLVPAGGGGAATGRVVR